MGSRFAPSFANLFMGWFEAERVWGRLGSHWIDYIHYWGRYIDCLLLWTGSIQQLESFFMYLNSNDYNLSFTFQCSKERIVFLDVELYVSGDNIHSKNVQKEHIL